MNRRELLKSGALAGGVLTLSNLPGFGKTRDIQNEIINQGYVKLKLNEIELFIFSDGHITLDSLQPVIAPEINSDEVKGELRKIFLHEEKLEAAINVMLIKKANKIILVDTGSGNNIGENGGWLLSNLEKAGIKAKDITDVFITHGHMDHIGGIVKKNNTLAYPNAQYYIAKKEYDFWMSENPDFSKSKSKSTQTPAERSAYTKGILNTIKDKLVQFNDQDVLFSCVKTELAEGHTPGHTIFTVFSGNKSIKHVVDIFHTSLLVAKPDWGTEWDVDFEKGVNTRNRILEDSYTKRTLVMTTHLPWPGVGYIGRNGNSYQWVPAPYFIPNEIVI